MPPYGIRGIALCGAERRWVGAWRRTLKKSQYLCRHIQFGIRDMPTVPFEREKILPVIPKKGEDKQFGLSVITSGLLEVVYEEVSREYALDQVKKGKLVSSAFLIWKGEKEN